MKLFIKVTYSILILFLLLSCESDITDVIEYPTTPVIDYAIQYNIDIGNIEEYLKTHSLTVVNHSGFSDDQEAIFETVPRLDFNSIWGSNPNSPKPSLLTKFKTIEGVHHKIYYIKFRDGIGTSPNDNNQLTSYYKGFLLDDTVFDQSIETGRTFRLNELILGWREILPEFKMGITTGLDQYEDFGAGVMFLPSALGYYQHSVGQIPEYSPIIFNFKVFKVF